LSARLSGASADRLPDRIAVLVSGRGSNLQAILDAIDAEALPARIVGVFSDKPAAAALERVEPALRWSANPKDFVSREVFDAALGDAIEAVRPDWVVCAGYLRILCDAFVERFRGRLLNIHPSLLPNYPGLRTHARAIADGQAEHGASVHFVIPELDAGTVVAQARVPVLPGDEPETLASRVLQIEHPLLLAVLRLMVSGRLAERGTTTTLDGHALFTPLLLDSAGALRARDSDTPV
jgi:phosphoribosylglycinamide formyltransferase 1